ncbi:hypothetical protein [Helicobacter mustelae]|uniref:Putative periplasmic protein n=1 Tax=Helicobacter mustelae (strain ATCC 43772 / CCUG 25715 / CIP 103759 / LMG 18044 / NCTC 12198 / R85-136P) TaxID=679897 RepID=D3UH52_HELM1|nr:hypothetical protein [Helicobacter mustelae]CBG39824.1 Putative periplasmic protein [Helicobacter mustelae 12198]SQH71334.1 periplasmic protein [Helicobacter mustelae]STP12460.1 periplasmic protein [Helicobacter mustelae]
MIKKIVLVMGVLLFSFASEDVELDAPGLEKSLQKGGQKNTGKLHKNRSQKSPYDTQLEKDDSDELDASDEAANSDDLDTEGQQNVEASSLDGLENFFIENQKILKERQEARASLQKWVHSIGVLNVYFDNGTLQYGYGVLLKNGRFLTSSEILHNFGKYPRKIQLRMQDDSAQVLICIADLQIEAIDNTTGLALLRTQGFTDDYCKVRTESFYHKRIYDLFYLTPQKLPPKAPETMLYYPKVSKQYYFGVLQNEILSTQELETGGAAYQIDDKKMNKMILGRPFFDKDGAFVGIFTIHADNAMPVVLDSTAVFLFLQNLRGKDF